MSCFLVCDIYVLSFPPFPRPTYIYQVLQFPLKNKTKNWSEGEKREATVLSLTRVEPARLWGKIKRMDYKNSGISPQRNSGIFVLENEPPNVLSDFQA